ncbi:MAG: dTDP-glucose 4,6-dehydratase [Acidimicrobiia bacterium]
MRVFVTGGCGFIGSNFLRHLLATHPDDSVTNYDGLTYAGNPANLADVEDDSRYSFVKGDICDADSVRAALAGHDAVVNFAAETHVDRSILGAGEFIRTNVSGVQTLLDAVKDLGIGRYVQISTDETYGSRTEGSFTEADALAPNNPYSASKAGADLLVRSYHVTHGLPVLVVRPSNNYGPYQFPEKVLPLFVTNLIDGLPVPLYGDGGNVRDWLFVEDNAAAIDTVLRKGAAGEIYNVTPKQEVTNLEITHKVLAAFGAGDDMIRRVPDRPGHDRRYSIDGTKIRSLGWTPAVELDAGLERTIAWYRDNEDWWRPLKAAAKDAALPTTGA